MTNMTGSEKQVVWAKDLFPRISREIEQACEEWKKELRETAAHFGVEEGSDKWVAAFSAIDAKREDLLSRTIASSWIEDRDKGVDGQKCRLERAVGEALG